MQSYDCWRLQRYLSIGDPHRGRIETLDQATLLHFQDVGYFNRIYNFCPANTDQLDTIRDRYLRSKETPYRYGVELIAKHDFDLDQISDNLRNFGFQPAGLTARLGLDLRDSSQSYPRRFSTPSRRIEFRNPTPGDYEAVLKLYLNGFGSPAENHQGAVNNMMQLFDQPEFSTSCAFDNDQPVGLGMLYLKPPFALLAAGVTAPGYQKLGIHESLIQLRLMHAKSLGCTRVFAWCESDGQSYNNLKSQGFELLRKERFWKLPGHRN